MKTRLTCLLFAVLTAMTTHGQEAANPRKCLRA
jgi:hypothetical protein